MSDTRPRIGVVVVAFQSAEIIDECLESLFAANGAELRVVVVDNNSTDDTCAVVRNWASGRTPFRVRADSPLPNAPIVSKPVEYGEILVGDHSAPPNAPLLLLRSPVNGGYAYAVNQGLGVLRADRDIDLFWVLNPDCVVPVATPGAIVDAARGRAFSLLGGRAVFYERPEEIQTDGGRVSRRTGRCVSLHAGLPAATTAMPMAASLDYITGASVVASRTFLEAAGPMTEDYFLYYEEVDWAYRRGDLPLLASERVKVFHRGGTTIGTGDTTRRPSPFANYFNYRNRMRFVRRFMPLNTALTLAYALAKAGQLMVKGARSEAAAILAGTFGRAPPRDVRDRIVDPVARTLAFGDRR